MPFKLQQLPEESKFCQHLSFRLLEQYYPRELVSQVLSACHAWEQRERKLSQLVIVYYVIALSLFRQFNVSEVFAHLSRGLRWLWPDPAIRLPTGGALTARRQSLGIPVLRQLFRHCCHPLASQATKGAFAFGLRLMAVDSTLDEVPDTAANAQHFGRLTTGKSQSPFPQVRCLYLAEVGTHAIVDAVLARGTRQRASSGPGHRALHPGGYAGHDRSQFRLGQLAPLCAPTRSPCPLAPGSRLLHPTLAHAVRWQLPGDAASQRTATLGAARD